jgi:hypothetical protein
MREKINTSTKQALGQSILAERDIKKQKSVDPSSVISIHKEIGTEKHKKDIEYTRKIHDALLSGKELDDELYYEALDQFPEFKNIKYLFNTS